MKTVEVRLRPLLAADIPRGLQLSHAAGWWQTEADWQWMAKHGKGFCAETADAGVAGVVMILDSCWIAMMLVDYGMRRLGIGAQLFERALLDVGPAPGLDATAEGREMYRRYSFEDAFSITRWHRVSDGGPMIVSEGSPASRFSTNGTPHIEGWRTGTSGWCLVRRGRSGRHCGPLVASSADEAAGLVGAAVNSAPADEWILDVPDGCGLELALSAASFRPVRQFVRMYRGPAPAQDPTLFATNGPEYGPTCIPLLH